MEPGKRSRIVISIAGGVSVLGLLGWGGELPDGNERKWEGFREGELSASASASAWHTKRNRSLPNVTSRFHLQEITK